MRRDHSPSNPDRPSNSMAVGWLLLGLSCLAVFLLAWMTLGDFKQAFRLEAQLVGHGPDPLLIQAGAERGIILSGPLQEAVKGQVRLNCRDGRGCQSLVMVIDGRLAASLGKEPGRAIFLLDLAKLDQAQVKNPSPRAVHLEDLRVQNYLGLNSNFPRAAILYDQPLRRDMAGWPYLLPLCMALFAQAWSLWVWRRGAFPNWGWQSWMWLGPLLAAVVAVCVVLLMGLRPLLSWDAFVLACKIGPFGITVYQLWRWRKSSKLVARLLPWAVVLAAFLCVTGLSLHAERGGRQSLHPTAMMFMGKHFARDMRWVPDGAVLEQKAFGYDGQFFLYMAQDPWATKGAWANIDSPAYRYQRMLYPWLLSLLSSDKQVLPWLMIGFNLAAVLACFVVIGFLCLRLGATLYWSLFFLAGYGLFQPVFLGLSEPLANLLMALGLWAAAGGAIWWAALAMSLMALSKEYYACLPLALAARAWLLGQKGRLAYLAPVAVGAAWQLWLMQRFGHPAWQQSNQGNFTWPLAGVIGLLGDPGHVRDVFTALGVLALAGLAVWLAWRDWRRPDLWALAAMLAMPLLVGSSVWGDYLSYPRVVGPAYLAYLLVLFRERSWQATIPAWFFGCDVVVRLLQI